MGGSAVVRIPPVDGSLSVVSLVYCHLWADVSATVRSLAQRSPTECGFPDFDRGTSTTRRFSTTRVVETESSQKLIKPPQSCHISTSVKLRVC